mmetsp:Transcript_114155/g.362886  ORF Transcript_114155/g.362886 Transcript_114155/m.362886 type:complete len:254 (-) Transcript_114155:255-1016(-)
MGCPHTVRIHFPRAPRNTTLPPSHSHNEDLQGLGGLSVRQRLLQTIIARAVWIRLVCQSALLGRVDLGRLVLLPLLLHHLVLHRCPLAFFLLFFLRHLLLLHRSTFDGAAVAEAQEPLGQTVPPPRPILLQIFFVQVRDRKFVLFCQCDARAQHDGVISAVGPTTSWVARVRAHGDATVKKEGVFLLEAVVSPHRHQPLHAVRIEGLLRQVQLPLQVRGLLDVLHDAHHVNVGLLVFWHVQGQHQVHLSRVAP